MSAFISLARDNCIEVVCDGAVYTPDGRYIGAKKKAIALPEIPATIFGRGADGIVGTISHITAITSPMADIVGEPNTFDDLMKRLELVLAPKIRDAILAEGEEIPGHAQSEICVAGFSRSIGPTVAVMRSFGITYDHGDAGTERLEPWKLYRLPSYYAAGPDIAEDIEAMGLIWDDLCRDGLRPYAVALIDAMRKRKDVNPFVEGEEPMHKIGGHVQIATVTRDDAQSEILHIWDDIPGEMIDPFRSAA